MERFKYVAFITLCLTFMLAGSPGLHAAPEVPVESWVARYNGPGNGYDWASAVAVDSDGNVYVTGESPGSGTYSDYATIKYAAAGTLLWERRYNGPGNGDDCAYPLAVDSDGNVYVTGGSTGSSTSYDYATIKYDTNGIEEWVARYNGAGCNANALAVDSDGNVYVTGESIGSGTGADYTTVKYNADGVEQWVAYYNGPGNGGDYTYAVAVDGVGNVYVTGQSLGIGTYSDYTTIKYDANGNEQWVARYNGPGNGYDYANALAVDTVGNVYVTGYSVGNGTGSDYATVKYDTDGNEQWVARYSGPGNSGDLAYALAVDAAGNVYVTGGSIGIGTGNDCATIKYDAAGTQLWVARYNGPGNGYDAAYALDTDEAGNIYITGGSTGSGTGNDCATIKYDAAGNQLWVAHYNGPGDGYDDAYALAVDVAGNVYVTGTSQGIGTSWDYVTIKYATPAEAIEDVIATIEDMNLQQGIDNNLDAKLQAVQDALVAANADLRNDAINKLEAFINAAEAQRGNKLTDEQATQLVNAANGIILALGGAPAAPALARVATSDPQLDQNYPNPFNPETWIPYRLKKDADVVISIRSATGQLVRTFNLGYKKAGSYTSMEKAVHWDGRNQYGEKTSSGIYFYTIQAGPFTATKKMIIAE